MKKKFLSLFMIFAVALTVAACGGSGSSNEVTVGQTWVISDENPLNGGNGWSLTSHGIAEYVYMQTESGKLESRFIDKAEKKSSLEWEATMKKDAKFSDGSTVDAKALTDALNAIMENNKLAHASAGKIKYEATGEFTFKATTERETNDIESIWGEWTNVVFKKDGDKFIFTGPFKVKELKAKSEVVLEANENYPEAKERPATVKIKAFKDINALKTAFEAGEVDLAFGLTGSIANELKEKKKNILEFDAGYQYLTFLNLNNEILKDSSVREAIDLAIDREAIKKALYGGTVPTGLYAHYFSFNGKSEVKADLEKAKSILENAGWTKTGEEKYRKKDGKELSLSIKTYSSKADLPIVSQTIASELEKLGVKAEVQVVDDIGAVTKSKDFDIVVYAQHTAPAGTPSYFLNQFFRQDGANNFTSYNSSEVEGILNDMAKATDKKEIDKLSIEAQKQILSDRPVLLTMDPKWYAAVSDKLKDYKLWNGDYYIVNKTMKISK